MQRNDLQEKFAGTAEIYIYIYLCLDEIMTHREWKTDRKAKLEPKVQWIAWNVACRICLNSTIEKVLVKRALIAKM